MSRHSVKVLLLSALLGSLAFLFVMPASAAQSNKRSVAVIIGNKNYANRIPRVEFAINDADAFRAYVVDVLGYRSENIIDLRDATKAQLESAFGNRETPEGKLWRYLDPRGRSDVTVFYSGHGVPSLKNKRGYLLPVDADPNAPEINGYSVDVLFNNLSQLTAKSISVFLDACFSGDSEKGMLIRATSGITIAPKLPEKMSTNMTIITAAQGDQVASWDFKSGHGMFTTHLLDALYGAADKGDFGNGDSRIALSEVSEYLTDNMTRAARREYGRHQNAWIAGGEETIVASVVPGVTRPKVVRRTTTRPVTKKAPVRTVAVQPVAPKKRVKPVVQKPAVRPKPKLKPRFNIVSAGQGSKWRARFRLKGYINAEFQETVEFSKGRMVDTIYRNDGLPYTMYFSSKINRRGVTVSITFGNYIDTYTGVHNCETVVDTTQPTTIEVTAECEQRGDDGLRAEDIIVDLRMTYIGRS